MSLCAMLLLVLSFASPSRAGDTAVFPGVDLDNPRSLLEASRVLEEELRLAARPQTYLLVDLATRTVQFKARGVELHRIPIAAWSAGSSTELKGIRRLISRPPVVRRKIDPPVSVELEPISLADMPTDYTLAFTPPLTIEVISSAADGPLQWIISSGKTWWRTLKIWGASFLMDRAASHTPHLYLEVSVDQAQSLAWSLVDGMALVIRRPTDK